MNTTNDSIYDVLVVCGLNVMQAVEVVDFSVSELPSLENKPTVSVNDSEYRPHKVRVPGVRCGYRSKWSPVPGEEEEK